MTSKTQQDRIEQGLWRLKALPVQLGSRLVPRRMARDAAGARRVHLGSGDNVLSGWANLDMGGPAGVIRFDLSRPLPFADSSVDFVFSEHFIEHVRKEAAAALLEECARILRPGGVLRISTPDLQKLVDEYQQRRTDEWLDMEWSPASPCDMVNEAMRLWGHLYVWDEQELVSALDHAGFRAVRRVAWRLSQHDELNGLECRPDHGDLIVEATR